MLKLDERCENPLRHEAHRLIGCETHNYNRVKVAQELRPAMDDLHNFERFLDAQKTSTIAGVLAELKKRSQAWAIGIQFICGLEKYFAGQPDHLTPPT